MKIKPSTKNWLIDASLFIGTISLFFLDLTGVGLHQWLGVVIGLLALYHLFVHSDWVEAVSKRFFGRTSRRARSYFLVDAGLLLGFEAILISGLAISTWLSLSLGNMQAWIDFHVTASIVTLLLALVKIAIHWRWIAQTARRMTPQSTPSFQGRSIAQLAAVPVRNDRRDFLKIMGIVGIGATLAILNVSIPSSESEAQTASAQSLANTTGSPGTITAQVNNGQSSNSTLTCIGRCPKGRSCSYPGQCRQYRDTNGNGRCDLGECA